MRAQSLLHQSDEFDRCKPWIEAALAYSGGTHTIEDIALGIAERRLQFWPAPNGCLVTELVKYPRTRVLNVFLGGGEFDQLVDMHGDVIAWAKLQGCTAATISGRKGWERAFKPLGWEYQFTTLKKDFD